MSAQTREANTSIFNRHVRPTKVGIVHGSSVSDSTISHDEIHAALTKLFSPLNIRVNSILELGKAGLRDLVSSGEYDVIGLVGEAYEFSHSRKERSGFLWHNDHTRNQDNDETILLSFTPRTRFKDAKEYLAFSDAVVLCDATGGNWPLEVSRNVYRLFESLVIPSMLNIDLADVKRIAKSVGLAFNVSDDDYEKIIEKLPKDCFVARSAILHFAVKDDVRLREIYSISKSIALKKGLENSDPQLSSHLDARKNVRRVNVKMGIRIINDDSEFEKGDPGNSAIGSGDVRLASQDEKRISVTGILFGI